MSSSTDPRSLDEHIPIEPNLDYYKADYSGEDPGLELENLGGTIHRFPVEKGRKLHPPGDYEQSLDEIDTMSVFDYEGCKKLLMTVAQSSDLVAHARRSTPPGSYSTNSLERAGRWYKTCDFAYLSPLTHVVGIDIQILWSPPSWKPTNLEFKTQPSQLLELEWSLPNKWFDFIHGSSVSGDIVDWAAYYTQVLEHLKPGGYYEQKEFSFFFSSDDGSVNDAHVFHQWRDVQLAAASANPPIPTGAFTAFEHQKQGMIDAGFEDVVERRMKIPVGPWSRDARLSEAGRWVLLQAFINVGYRNGIRRVCEGLGWSEETTTAFLARFKKGLQDKSVHAYLSCSVVYGKKPKNTWTEKDFKVPLVPRKDSKNSKRSDDNSAG